MVVLKAGLALVGIFAVAYGIAEVFVRVSEQRYAKAYHFGRVK